MHSDTLYIQRIADDPDFRSEVERDCHFDSCARMARAELTRIGTLIADGRRVDAAAMIPCSTYPRGSFGDAWGQRITESADKHEADYRKMNAHIADIIVSLESGSGAVTGDCLQWLLVEWGYQLAILERENAYIEHALAKARRKGKTDCDKYRKRLAKLEANIPAIADVSRRIDWGRSVLASYQGLTS